MKHIYIINPAAGRNDATADLSEKIRQAYAGENVPELDIYQTTGIGDATRYVREYCTAHPEEQVYFYACGGDGTFSEVAGGAVGFANAAVGLVPVGTGNDFMRGFDASEHFMELEAQRNGQVIELDMIRCNDYYGVNLLNTGFDCEVVVKTSEIKRKKWVPHSMAYGLGVAIELIRKPGVTVELSVDGGEPRELDLLLTCVANGAYCGGGFYSAPRSAIDDGVMDVCFISNLTRRRFISIVSSYKDGTYIDRDDVADIAEYVKCSRLEMKFPQLHSVSIDGELEDYNSILLTVASGALRFCLPEGCDTVKAPAQQAAHAEV